MSFAHGVWILALALVAAPPARGGNAPAKIRIALTAFVPFGKMESNSSQEVARKLREKLEASGRYETLLCDRVPVSYEKAFPHVQECIGNWRPDWILSFGQGFCEIRLETQAVNRDQSPIPDNDGTVRDAYTEIVRGGKERESFRYPADRMYCAIENPALAGVVVSDDAGTEACNHLSYLLAREYGGGGIPFAFLHLPANHPKCAYSIPPGGDRAVETIYKMVEAAAPHLSDAPLWPKTEKSARSERKSFLKKHAGSPDAACRAEFREKLIQAIETPNEVTGPPKKNDRERLRDSPAPPM